MKIYINHVGYLTHGSKFCVVEHPFDPYFYLLEREQLTRIYKGELKRVSGDLGEAWVGDFSDFCTPGAYLIECNGQLFQYPTRSETVVIADNIFDMAIRTIYNYFPTQRCGDTTLGWASPCHCDDAFSSETGEHRDFAGGWHQSCDVRKWIFSTAWGLFGMHALQNYTAIQPWLAGKALEELKWGNQYFAKLVKENGQLYDSIIYPNSFEQREFYDNDPPFCAVANVIAGQCMVYDAFQSTDTDYAEECLKRAERVWSYYTSEQAPKKGYTPKRVPKCHEWLPHLFEQNYPGSALYEGDRAFASLWLYQTSKKTCYLEDAIACAKRLCALQQAGDPNCEEGAGTFYRDPSKKQRVSASDDGALGPLCLLKLSNLAPKGEDRTAFFCAAKRYADHLAKFSAKNPWGMVACYDYATPVQGARGQGKSGYYYRYFDNFNTFGVNKDLLGRTLFLLKIFEREGDRAYLDTATRQIDFILGLNMLNASTVEGVGRNQPERLFNTTDFDPKTPQIPGAVMTGIAGHMATDEPYCNISLANEYDMPATSFMLMALIELQKLEYGESHSSKGV